MINYFRQHLGAKLFLSYLAIILVGAVVLGITTSIHGAHRVQSPPGHDGADD